MDRFMPQEEDRVLWGELVKAWAKGTQMKPATLAELEQQMADRGLAPPTMPEHITGLVFVQNDKHVLTITLPSKEVLEAIEGTLGAGPGSYGLPAFYDDFYVAPARRDDFTETEVLNLHAARLGEYVVNSCL